MFNTSAKADIIGFLPNRDLLDLDAAPHLWNINSVTIGETATEITGWSLPHGGRIGNNGLSINGKVFAVRQHDKPAGVYAELYPWHPNAAFAGFALTVDHRQLNVPATRELEMRSVALDGADEPRGYALHLLVEDLGFDMPSPEIAARIGVGETMHYTMFGRSIYAGFDAALRRATGAGFEAAGTVVDWGCGSGRVARHIGRQLKPGQTLMGFDIDAPAVAWSNAAIGPHFAASTIAPPLNVASASVDVVVAYSVFTHLAEAPFGTWIEELARVLKPGGILLFTVLGDFAMASLAPAFPRVAHEAWRKRGIYDDSGNRQLETIDVGGETYRNTWVKRGFIERQLAKSFKLVDYVSPFHFYQDLVVARRA